MGRDQMYTLLDTGSNLSRKDLAKVSHEAFWRGQSILNCRLEGDNILMKVMMRKQIKWPQNVSQAQTTLLINGFIFILLQSFSVTVVGV